MEKQCFKCARRLPIEQFYRHPATADGRLGKCKGCTRLDVQANYVAKRATKLVSERARSNSPERRETRRRAREALKRTRPDKVAAQAMAKAAIAAGFLRPLPCAVCGASKTDGHHEDYGRPLDLTWLCRTHHARRHAELKAAGIEI